MVNVLPRSQSSDWLFFLVWALFSALLTVVLVEGAWANQSGREEQEASDLIARADELGLAENSQWRRLLHMRAEARQSNVISPDFFLAPTERWNPGSELHATLRAWFEPLAADPNTHPRCRFPGRYAWLRQHLSLPATSTAPVQCPALERWAKLGELRSISVIMVSGYFGNPASSFGHLLMKLNHGDESSGSRLLDLGVNYGAAVPEGEWAVAYILRGLFGGYHAGFSDRSYYVQDQSYSRVEFRDMWEYELSLDRDEEELLLFHLWESIGHRFGYYFLRENCALRLAELLELATGEDFGTDPMLWYAPVTFFHRLEDADQKADGTLVESVKFIPSSQRVLYHEFSRLDTSLRFVFNSVISQELLLTDALASLPDAEEKIALLDVLLAYYQYRLAPYPDDDDTQESHVLDQRKNEVLLLRLALPPSTAPNTDEIPPLRSPPKGSKPSKGGLALARNSEFGGYLRGEFSSFHYDSIGNNNLAGSALIVLDASLGYAESEGLFIDQVDFIRARKVNVNTVRIAGESSWSWDVATGLKRDRLDCTSCLELYASAAMGRAHQLDQNWIAHATVEARLESKGDRVVLRPELGLRHAPSNRSATRFVAGLDQCLEDGGSESYLEFETRWSLSTNRELRLSARRQGTHEIAFGFFQYW